jgi:hypothetical protein
LAGPRKGSSAEKALGGDKEVRGEKKKVKRKRNRIKRSNREMLNGETAEKKKPSDKN